MWKIKRYIEDGKTLTEKKPTMFWLSHNLYVDSFYLSYMKVPLVLILLLLKLSLRLMIGSFGMLKRVMRKIGGQTVRSVAQERCHSGRIKPL